MVNSRCGLPFQVFLVDLPFQVFLVDLPWGSVLKSGVPALRIVPEFDVPHNVPARVLASRESYSKPHVIEKKNNPRAVSYVSR